jgi:hypothetical protein
MMKPPKKATRPDVLARVGGLGLFDAEIERDVPLPRGFLSKSRAGKNGDDRAEASWKKLTAWLDARAGVAPAPSSPDEGKLVAAIRAADTLGRVDALLVQLLEEVATGDVEPSRGRAIGDLLRERRQTMAAIAEERARLNADKPVSVVVEFRNDYVGKPACERCHGTGREN